MISRYRKSIVVAGLAAALALPACAALRREEARSSERLLAAAGFRVRPAGNPERLAHLQTEPPYTVLQQTNDGHVVYTYADPEDCKCVYVGGPSEYAAYERLLEEERQRRLEEDLARDGPPWPWCGGCG